MSLAAGAGRVLAFRDVDRQAGPSANGAYLAGAQPTREESVLAASQPNVTVRLAPAFALHPLRDVPGHAVADAQESHRPGAGVAA